MEKQKLNHVSVELKFENFKPINNTGFVRGECKIAYAGKNRNYSNISKDAFEKAESTLFGVPVVGNWIEDSSEEFGGRFGGHDIILETKGNQLILKDNTVPFGFVPQDANPRWVEVKDENGNSKNYYTADVILWRERYKNQVDSIIEKSANQSMEIMVTDGDWDENWEYFNINDFYYSALCLLGRDEDDLSKNVEPCFEDSEIVVSDFSFNEDFSAKVFELKKAFEGGENVTVEEKIDETTEEIVETEEVFEEEVVKETDVVEKTIEAEEIIKEFNEEVTEVTEEAKEDFELKYNNMLEQFNALQGEFNLLKSEVEDLREYKRVKEEEIDNARKDDLIADYSLLLTEDEIDIAISNKSEMTYEEIELALSKAFAKKSLEEMKSKKVDKKDTTIVFENKVFEDDKKKNRFAI